MSLIIDAVHDAHTDDRPREMLAAPAGIITKFCRARKLLATRAAFNSDFAASLTDTERDIIIEYRQRRRK